MCSLTIDARTLTRQDIELAAVLMGRGLSSRASNSRNAEVQAPDSQTERKDRAQR